MGAHATGGKLSVGVPGYGVVTLEGQGVGSGSGGAGGTTGAGGSGAGGGSGTTGAGGGAAGGPGGAASTPRNPNKSGGCGCRTACGGSSGAPLFALPALFGCWFFRRDRG